MSVSDAAMREFETERSRICRITQKGVGMPIAGMLFWIAYAILVRVFPIEKAVLLSFVATGAVFPLGTLFTRMAGGDLFAKSPSLSALGIQLAALQIFFWPVLILVWNLAPDWSPFVMGILFGSHFLPYWWLYRSPAYGLLAILSGVALVAMALIARDPLPRIAPLVTAAAYAVAIALLVRELVALRRSSSPRGGEPG